MSTTTERPYPPMNPEVKKKWIEALRSGEYKQGHNALRVISEGGFGYCCLGVLCDLMKQSGLGDWVGFSDFMYADQIQRSYPQFEILEKIDMSFEASRILSSMNDQGCSFEEISNWIEENL